MVSRSGAAQRVLLVGAAVLALTTVDGPATAAVLCQKRSGALFVRPTKCKGKKETVVTAAQIGAVGQMGPPGPTGPAGRSLLTPLQSGETESGACGLGFHASAGTDIWYAYQQFSIPLAAAIAGSNAVLVTGASATNCPGVGSAAPGYLCVYVTHTFNVNAAAGFVSDVETGDAGASKYGFAVQVKPTGGVDAFLDCVYSVTAP